MMTTYDFVHLTLLALGGKINGKTKLQKTVYFLGLLTGNEGTLGFRPHYYGPYSDEVSAAVERLKSLGFLEQTVSSIGAVDARGFEVARHDYRLTGEGQVVGELKTEKLGEEWDLLKKAATAHSKLLECDYMKLSIAAKTWFLLRTKMGTATTDELEALAPKFGWSVSHSEIHEAAEILREAGLTELQS